ncbi:MAG: hypothetical protein H7Y19_17540 [Luteimonas sp.]|jgi:hypothetical protein|nr:hypothetical protein [Luteimonas sp.]
MATKKAAIKSKAAISEVRLNLASDTSFDEIVSILKVSLTIPELPGFRGCRPCLSGLDRFVIQDLVMRGMR